MPEINGLSRSMTMQPTMNVDELLNSQKTDDTKKTESPSDVGKTDKTGAKAELEEVVHDDTALNGQTAENFVKTNTVEAGKDKAVTDDKKTEGAEKKDGAEKTEKKDGAEKAEKKDGTEKAEGEKKTDAAAKKDGDIKVWFDKHPRFKLAMVILEQILDAVIGVMSGIASKLPDGVGGCITGGLSVIKGLAGFHKLDSMEADLSKVIEDVKEGGEQIASGIETLISEPTTPTPDSGKGNTTTPEPGLAAKIIGCVGTMCGELSGAKSWEDVLNTVGKSAANIVAAASPDAAEITGAVNTSMGNFTKAISRGVEEAKKGIKNSDSTNDEKTMNALEMFKKTLSEDATLSEEEKNLVKALSDGAIESIKTKGSKKALDAYEGTLGAVSSAFLKGKNKEIAEQTLALMKEIRAEEDPFKAALLVLDKAKKIAGGESKEIDKLKEAVTDAGKTVEKAADPNVSESSVQTDVGSFKDRLKNLEKLMKG